MQNRKTLQQPLLGELAMSRNREREREKNAIYSGHLCLCLQPKGSARTPLGPISHAYSKIDWLFIRGHYKNVGWRFFFLTYLFWNLTLIMFAEKLRMAAKSDSSLWIWVLFMYDWLCKEEYGLPRILVVLYGQKSFNNLQIKLNVTF